MENQAKHSHDGESCHSCDHGIGETHSWEKKTFLRLGYYCHFVPEAGGFVNAHTHGFDASWEHPDFQIVLPIPPDVCSSILHKLSLKVKAGEKFSAGDTVEDLTTFGSRLDAATENGRDVLRVIFPDARGKYPEDAEVDEIYALQVVWATA